LLFIIRDLSGISQLNFLFRNLANGETPDTKNISEKDHPEISIEIDATEECSSTSRKSHSKFFGRISKPHLLGENSEQCNKFDVVPPQIDQQSNDRCAVYVEKSVRMKSSDTIATGLGEGGGPPMATVKRLNPRGLAPIVHADSLIELSTSGPSAGASPKL
jgi:hypothetical protein